MRLRDLLLVGVYTLGLWALLMLFIVAGWSCIEAASASPLYRRSLATSFTHTVGPNAKWNGEHFACYKGRGNRWAKPGTRGYRKVRMNGGEVGVAHRRLPCGTLVRITHKGRSVVVPVVDRGPYWQVPADCAGDMRGRWGKRAQRCWSRGKAGTRMRAGFVWASDLDITKVAARRLRLGGRAWVDWRPVRSRRRW